MESAIAAMRKRPGMFVGSVDTGDGVQHLVYELLANAYDQYLAGRCTRVSLHVDADGTITIEDNGPGIPAGGSATLPPLAVMLTERSERPTVDGHRPHAHMGIGALGLVTVNALSERFEIVTVHDGVCARGVYARGEVVEAITTAPTQAASGTRVRCRPDRSIFACDHLSRPRLSSMLEDLSFLAPGLQLAWMFAGDDFAAHGLAGLVAARTPCPIDAVAHHRARYETANGPLDVEVALAWIPRTSGWPPFPAWDSFVNLARTREHGLHVAGVLDGIAEILACTPHQARSAGFSFAVSVVLADVIYGSPARDRLDSPAVRAPVTEATRAALAPWAAAHPAQVRGARGHARSPLARDEAD